MKHNNTIGIIGGTLAALALLVGSAAGIAHAQTSTTTATTTPGTATTTPATTTPPVISSVSSAPSSDGTTAAITWLTNVNADSQVAYGLTSNYTATSTVNAATTTDHTVNLNGLTPNTTYHFQAISTDQFGNTGRSADMTFTTTVATTSPGNGNNGNNGGTGTTTDVQGQINNLQTQINVLQGVVASLQAQINRLAQIVNSILNGNTGGNNGGGTVTPPVTPAPATLTPSSTTVSPGTHLDFNGRNFGMEEAVNITMNGTQVGTAHADGGGNFTTGSMTMPSTPGTYTFTFTGANSGTSLNSVVTVQ